jgi:hypothetical protein
MINRFVLIIIISVIILISLNGKKLVMQGLSLRRLYENEVNMIVVRHGIKSLFLLQMAKLFSVIFKVEYKRSKSRGSGSLVAFIYKSFYLKLGCNDLYE